MASDYYIKQCRLSLFHKWHIPEVLWGPNQTSYGKGFERHDGQHKHKLESWGFVAEAPLGDWNLVYKQSYLLPVPMQETLSQGVNKSSGSPEESDRRPGIH